MKKSINVRLAQRDLDFLYLLSLNRTETIESLISEKRMKMMIKLSETFTFGQAMELIECGQLEVIKHDTIIEYRIDAGKLIERHKGLGDNCIWTETQVLHTF